MFPNTGDRGKQSYFFSKRQVLKCFVMKLDLSVSFVTVAWVYLLFTIYVRVTATIPERKKKIIEKHLRFVYSGTVHVPQAKFCVK